MFCKLAASNSFERTLQSAACILLSTSRSALALAKQSDEETSDRPDGQNAGRSLSVDGEAVPGGEQAPAQGRTRRSAPDLSTVREGDLSDRLHQQDDGGLVCPPCKVHGKLVRLGGPRVHGAVVYPCTYARMCVSICVRVCRT